MKISRTCVGGDDDNFAMVGDPRSSQKWTRNVGGSNNNWTLGVSCDDGEKTMTCVDKDDFRCVLWVATRTAGADESFKSKITSCSWPVILVLNKGRRESCCSGAD